MLASLPAAIDDKGKVDTLLSLPVGDDVHRAADKIKDLRLRLLLSDPATSDLPAEQKIESVLVRDWMVPKREGGPGPAFLWTSPPAKGIEDRVEVRLNNILLAPGRVRNGWLEYPVDARQLARGANLVGISGAKRASDSRGQMLLEKLELDVSYRRDGRR